MISIDIIDEPCRREWGSLCTRPSNCDEKAEATVASILRRVREGGDRALRELSEEIDGIRLDNITVSKEEISEAEELTSTELKKAIATAASNIKAFHNAQIPTEIRVETAPGVICLQRPVPIRKVGLYVPGGTAPLFSTVLMLAIPAKVAGCKETVMCTPVGKNGKVNPAVLYAASFCGIEKIYKLGGAGAVAAMAYGTESVTKVDKIFGPGNRYVTAAKQMLSGREVAIDMPAGPSEVMVIADCSADPKIVASDLLSQAEHGRDSQVVLLCSDKTTAVRTLTEVERQLSALDRRDFALSSLEKSRFIVFSDHGDTVDFANTYAPEHLIVNTADPWKIVDGICCAGSVFVGGNTPESAGDYASGTNHTLPTSAWARSYSGVNIDSYMRKMTIQEISRDGLEKLGPTIVTMAEAEGLQAHANAVTIRLSKQ